MKKILAFVFVLMMSISSYASIVNPTTSKEDLKKEIRSKIVTLLGNVDFSLDKELAISVDLMINKKGQLVVLDLNTTNQDIVDYVTRKLNYKRVAGSLSNSVKIYKMPLRIVK